MRRPARPTLFASISALLALVGLVGARWVWADGVGHKVSAAPIVSASTPSVRLSGPDWVKLSAAQRQVLQPLQGQWADLDNGGRIKWLNVADRYAQLTPDEQQRVQERMNQWAKLRPQDRGEARLRFQQTRQLSPDERQQKWAEYQALSDGDRTDLARQGQRKAQPVFLPDNVPGPREAAQAFNAKRQATAAASPRKTNVVPPPLGTTTPTVVTPTLVKAGPGATTSLVTQTPAPPLHPRPGLPQNATQAFVDPITLLPRKGAQSAAMASLPASASNAGADPTLRR